MSDETVELQIPAEELQGVVELSPRMNGSAIRERCLARSIELYGGDYDDEMHVDAARLWSDFILGIERPDPDALIPTSAEEAPAVDNPSETPAAGVQSLEEIDRVVSGLVRAPGAAYATGRAMSSRRSAPTLEKYERRRGELAQAHEAAEVTTHDHATEPVSPGDMSGLGSDTDRASEDETEPVNSLGGSPATEADADPVETFSGPASTDPEEPAEDPASDPASDAVDAGPYGVLEGAAPAESEPAEDSAPARQHWSWLGG